MPSLQIRDLPEDIYRKLVRQAEKEHRSLSQEAVVVLARCLGGYNAQERRREILRRVLAKPQISTEDAKLPDPAELLREDRER
jgi:plasmid stability protein